MKERGATTGPRLWWGVWLPASWFELAGGEPRGAGWQSSGAGNRREAAVSLDAEAADSAVRGIPYVKEATAVTQGHVNGEAFCGLAHIEKSQVAII
jgi:hypothetical protein